MVDSRPPIPADIRRRVLIESGHRCAIPACRHLDVDAHHIVEWAETKAHDYANLIALCPNCHRRAHKGEIDRKSLQIYKANLRFTHDKFSQLEVDILFELVNAGSGQEGAFWPRFNLLLIKRIAEAEFITTRDSGIRMQAGGYEAGPVVISITEKGRAFVDSLGTTEL